MGPRSPESPAYGSPHVKEMKEEGGVDGNSSVCENSSSVATPSSVHLIGSPLVRELSDLSGSYDHVNGSPLPAGSRGGIPRNIFGSPRESPLTLRQPWHQAHSLSSPAPETDGPRMPVLDSVSGSQDMIMVEGNGGVEVMSPQLRSETTLPEKRPIDVFESGTDTENHDRCPIVIVLMNPGFKSYELMQLWLDTKTDTVRDVLHTLRQSLPSTWNQDYDGLAQFRRDRLSQLINCLRIQQFAVVPFEIWVAKPWALSADHTAKYAENLLEHLRTVGVVNANTSSSSDSPPRVGETPAASDGVLTLSEEAKRRVFAPGGILTHHHAIQFLSFGPPFEKPFERPPVFPSSVAVTKRHATTTPPTPVDRTASPCPPSPIASPTNDDVSLVSANFYTEIDLESGVPQSRESPPRATSPQLQQRAFSPGADSFTSFPSSTKSPDFSTDASSDTQESQDWDDGTIRVMNSNKLRDGSRRFSLQSIASQYELTLNRRRSPSNKNSGRRFIGLRTCFAGLSCARRTKQEVIETEGGGSEEFTAQGSAFSASFGNDDTLGEHLLTLYEVDEEDESSMAEMPLLSTSGYAFDEFVT